MEENIINIATLTIDSTKASDAIVATKNSLFDLQKANTDLRKEIQTSTGDTSKQTETFIQNEIEIKKLSDAYNDQKKAMSAYTTEELKATDAISKTIKTQNEATTNTRELTTARRNIDATTIEGAKIIADINEKIDKNNKFITYNSSLLERQKDNIGNYASASDGFSKVLEKQGGIYGNVRTQVLGFQSTVSSSIDTVKSVHNSVVAGAQGIMGFGNASKIAAVESANLAASQKAAGVAGEVMGAGEDIANQSTKGLIGSLGVLLFPITVIIAAGLLLYNVFKDFGPIINPIKDGITALGAVFTVLKTAVLDLVTGTRSLGDIFSTLTGDIADATVETYKLESAQRTLTKAMDIQELSSARTATKVKELILQSKDLTKTIEERTALINKAQSLEENEFQNRFKNYKTEKELLIRKLSVGKTVSEEEKQILREGDYEFLKSIAKKRKLDSELVEAYKKNQLSREQLLQEDNQIQEKAQNYKNKIVEKDQAKKEKAEEAASKKAEDNSKKEHDRQLKSLANTRLVFESEISTTEEKLKFYENYYSKLNKLEGNENKIKNAKDLSATILNIAKSEIDGEIELQTKKIQEKKTLDEQQKKDLIANAEFLKSEQTKSVQKSLLNEVDKNAALLEIQKGFNENVAVINKEFEDGESARKEEQKTLDALDHEIKMLVLEEQGYSELELKSRILKEEHDERIRLISEQVDAEGNLTKTALKQREIEDKKYAKATKAIDKEVAKNKKAMTVDIVKQSIAAASIMFEDNKALAVATALISTYEGIAAQIATKPKTPYEIGLVIANSAVVAATGFAAVRNIMKTDKGSSGGLSTGSGTTASASVFENPAKTQTVASVGSAPTIEQPQGMQPVLVLETLDEAKKNQIIKVNSN